MRNFYDPTLTAISRKLRDIDFEPDDTLDHGADSLTVLHGVQMFPPQKNNPGAPREYAVFLYVACKQRIIGKTKWKAAACRFADMARMKFYKHKQRHAVEPVDKNLNFTVAQAKSDLQFEQRAVALLNEIEAHFIEKGFWREGGAVKETRNNTARWTMAKAIRMLEADMEVVKEQLAGLISLAQLQPESFKQFEANRKRVPDEITAPDAHAKVELLNKFFTGIKQNIDPIAELLPTP